MNLKATAHTFVDSVPRTPGALTSSTHNVRVVKIEGERAYCKDGSGRGQYYNLSQLNFQNKKAFARLQVLRKEVPK